MSYQLSLKDYLKKFSSISNKFIDDFFSLYDENTKDTDFIINIESISIWLKLRKDSIKKTLTESYRQNIDYKVSKKNANFGRPSELIMLTSDCFKRICMLTKSSKGEEVRSYYIQLEKHIDKYKDNIINDLRSRVNVLERNMKPIEISKEEGVIYVLNTHEDIGLNDIYKLGISENFKSRLATHHSSHADNVEVKHIYKTSDVKGVERCLRAVLREKQYRKKKEFYQIDLESLKKLIETCGNALLLVKKSKQVKSGGGNKEGNYYIYLDK
jgi:phage anti-repressor protein